MTILPSYMIIYDRVSIYKPKYIYSPITGDPINKLDSVVPIQPINNIDAYSQDNKDKETVLDEQLNNQQYFFFLQSLKNKKEE